MNYTVQTAEQKQTTKPKIAYQIRESLYLNITNECSNECYFCVRFKTDYVRGHNLRLPKEPTLDEVIAELESAGDLTSYKEVVFCGYGEPTIRFDLMKEIAGYLKQKGVRRVRLNTNGHGNIINNRNIVPELVGLIDAVSISLNAENETIYTTICKPRFGKEAYHKVLEFITECKKYIPDVEVTVVGVPEIDVQKCKEIAKRLGVRFRFRELDKAG